MLLMAKRENYSLKRRAFAVVCPNLRFIYSIGTFLHWDKNAGVLCR